jgi:uncharacterized membrane protein YjgN (DUF898 family)
VAGHADAWRHAQDTARRVPLPRGPASRLHDNGPDTAQFPAFPAFPAWTPCSSPRLHFTGTGSEYFRLWVIHTLLIVLTLGLYSAWAQQRQLRWWARHTVLDGDPFDFHGAPRRMLMHRLFALVLLLGVWLATLQTVWMACTMLGVMALGASALMMRTRRFRLHHMSWRGVRFGQRARASQAVTSRLPLAMVGGPLGPQPSRAMLKLLLTQGWLVPLTLGLYWPFLAVRLVRLRLELLTPRADDLRAAIDLPARSRAAICNRATGPALGLDLGW